ncbi:MAG: type II toxin-antitoxin system VapC family toxin [Bryobacteraceae bacterium]
MSNCRIYIDACCFIEMACHSIGTHKKEREDDIPFLKQILQAFYNQELEVYTSILSVAECQCAYTTETRDNRIITDDIKKLFKDMLMSGQFVVLVQDSVLVAEKARNLYWVHQLAFSGADAVHIASALEMRCDEYLTFDEKAHKKASELEQLGITVLRPKDTKCVPKKLIEEAEKERVKQDQTELFLHTEQIGHQATELDDKQ